VGASIFGLELSQWSRSPSTTVASDLFLVQHYWLVSCKKGVECQGIRSGLLSFARVALACEGLSVQMLLGWFSTRPPDARMSRPFAQAQCLSAQDMYNAPVSNTHRLCPSY